MADHFPDRAARYAKDAVLTDLEVVRPGRPINGENTDKTVEINGAAEADHHPNPKSYVFPAAGTRERPGAPG